MLTTSRHNRSTKVNFRRNSSGLIKSTTMVRNMRKRKKKKNQILTRIKTLTQRKKRKRNPSYPRRTPRTCLPTFLHRLPAIMTRKQRRRRRLKNKSIWKRKNVSRKSRKKLHNSFLTTMTNLRRM